MKTINFTTLHKQSQLVRIYYMVKLAFMRSFGSEKISQHAFYSGAIISLINVDNYI